MKSKRNSYNMLQSVTSRLRRLRRRLILPRGHRWHCVGGSRIFRVVGILMRFHLHLRDVRSKRQGSLDAQLIHLEILKKPS